MLPDSRNRVDLGCYVLRVQACQILYKSWKSWVSCGRCRLLGCFGASHQVDQVSIQSDRSILFGNVCSFFMDPDSVVQPHSVMLSWVKRVHKLCFKYCVLFSFPYLDCIMRWIDLFVESGMISSKSYHAVDRFAWYRTWRVFKYLDMR
jgi:hypothetical protein